MRIENGRVWLDLPADLVDEALMVASASAPDALREQYRAEREAISTIEIVDIREASFRELDSVWTERLGIMDSLRDLLNGSDALGRVVPAIRGCMVGGVRADVDEGAHLADGVLYLALRAESLLSPDRLREIVGRVF